MKIKLPLIHCLIKIIYTNSNCICFFKLQNIINKIVSDQFRFLLKTFSQEIRFLDEQMESIKVNYNHLWQHFIHFSFIFISQPLYEQFIESKF